MDLVLAEFPESVAGVRGEVVAGNPSYPLQFAMQKGAVRLFLCYGSSKHRDEEEAYVEFEVNPGRQWLIKTLRSFGVKRTWAILVSDYCREPEGDA